MHMVCEAIDLKKYNVLRSSILADMLEKLSAMFCYKEFFTRLSSPHGMDKNSGM